MKNRFAAALGGMLLASFPNAVFAANGFTPNLHLINPSKPVLGVQDVEPAIRVDSTGRIFVSAIRGVPAGIDLWQVAPNGAAFAYRGQPDGLPGASGVAGVAPGGGDTDEAIGSFTQAQPGPLLITSLNLGTIYASQTSDAGMSYLGGGNAAGAIVVVDRQWNAAQGGLERYDVTHDLATGSIQFSRSMDGGLVWVNGTPTTTPITPIAAMDNELGSIVVDRVHGILYQVFTSVANTSEAAANAANPNGTSYPEHTVWVAKSVDDGQTWTDTIAYNGPITESYAHIFPTIAVDYVGNLFVGWCDGNNISVTYSTDGGRTYALPVKVTGGIGDPYGTHVFPWLAAAGNGGVDLTYYATPGTDPNAATNKWVVGFAQNINVPRNPSAWTLTVASDHIVHTGQVCEGGIGCSTGGNRNLSDDFQVAVDPQGFANIAFTDDSAAPAPPQTYFTKQLVGSLLPTNANDDGTVDNHGCSEDGTTNGQRSEMRVKAPERNTQGWLTLVVGPSIVASGPLSAYNPTSETSGTIAGRTLSGTAFAGTITNGALDLTLGANTLHFSSLARSGLRTRPLVTGAPLGTRKTFASAVRPGARVRADTTSTSPSNGSCHLEG